jgi:hypothetical protein
VTDVRREVEHGPAPTDQFQVLGERLELPANARGQRRGVHVLDVLERAHDHIVVLGRVGAIVKPQLPATTVVTP